MKLCSSYSERVFQQDTKCKSVFFKDVKLFLGDKPLKGPLCRTLTSHLKEIKHFSSVFISEQSPETKYHCVSNSLE